MRIDPKELPFFAQQGDTIRTLAICNKTVGKNQKVFMSDDGIEKYRAFKNLDRQSPNAKHIKELQSQGIGIPLFVTDAKYFQMYGGRVLTVYQCIPPEPNSFFSTDGPKVKTCTVKVTYKSRYKRYELDFHQLGFKINFFMHFRFPFGDFMYKGKRYRWLRYSYLASFRTNDYNYTLYEIDPHQASLVDDVNSRNEIENSNLLLGGKVKTFFLQGLGDTNFEYDKFVSDRKVGLMEFLPFNNIFGLGSLQKNCTFTMPMPNTSEPDSILSATEDTIVFTTMACLLKVIEDYRTDKRRN